MCVWFERPHCINTFHFVHRYAPNPSGQQIQTVTKVKVTTKKVKVKKNVIARRTMTKFGACAGAAPGPEKNITYVSYEQIDLNLRIRKRGEDEDENDPLNKLGKGKGAAADSGDGSIVVCRHCGETGHWTLKCPKRGKIIPKGMDAAPPSKAAAAAESDGKYVPMHLRAGAGSAPKSGFGRFGDEAPALRVTNISEDTTEDDLRALFRNFGHTTRIYLARDKSTGQSRGFAFVNYQTMSEAQAAIDGLDGHGYDNLILSVEFAKPREEKEKSQAERTQHILNQQRRKF